MLLPSQPINAAAIPTTAAIPITECSLGVHCCSSHACLLRRHAGPSHGGTSFSCLAMSVATAIISDLYNCAQVHSMQATFHRLHLALWSAISWASLLIKLLWQQTLWPAISWASLLIKPPGQQGHPLPSCAKHPYPVAASSYIRSFQFAMLLNVSHHCGCGTFPTPSKFIAVLTAVPWDKPDTPINSYEHPFSIYTYTQHTHTCTHWPCDMAHICLPAARVHTLRCAVCSFQPLPPCCRSCTQRRKPSIPKAPSAQPAPAAHVADEGGRVILLGQLLVGSYGVVLRCSPGCSRK